MQRINSCLLVGLLASSLTWPAVSAQLSYKQVVSQLNEMLTARQFEQAFQFADQYTLDLGGEPQFDLLKGLAAYGSGRFQEAVFAFERVVINEPKSYIGRVYLARSYAQVDNLDAALVELQRLESQPLNEIQREEVTDLRDRLSNRINKRTSNWYHTIAVNLVQDSNVNSGTDVDQIELPGATWILSESSKETSDSGYQLSYSGGYRHAFNQKQWLRLEFSANQFGFQEFSQYDRQQLSFSADYEQDVLSGKFSIGAYTRPIWLQLQVESNTVEDITVDPETETALYRIDSGLRTSYQRAIGQRSAFRISADYGLIVNEENPDLDYSKSKVSLGFNYQSEWFHGITLSWQQDTADNQEFEHISKDVIGLAYQVSIPYTNSFISSHYILFENHEFAQEHPLFQDTRSETLLLLSNQGIYRLTEHQQIKATLNYQYKDSNIDLFKYDRLEAGLGWQIRF